MSYSFDDRLQLAKRVGEAITDGIIAALSADPLGQTKSVEVDAVHRDATFIALRAVVANLAGMVPDGERAGFEEHFLGELRRELVATRPQ